MSYVKMNLTDGITLGEEHISHIEDGIANAEKAIPKKLPNPNSLKFTGAATVEYDGSEDITVNIPQSGGSTGIPRIETSSATQELEPNKLYVFPEMESLSYSLKTPENTQVVNEYHFMFASGATATELVHPLGVKIGSFTVDANKIYEVSILENLLTAQSWEES